MPPSEKTIIVSPSEVEFDQVIPHALYYERLQLTNTLSAPVQLTLSCTNSERLDVQPRSVRLDPHQTSKVEISLRQVRPFPAKTTKQKEILMIKSDFFDQKVAIAIYPAFNKTISRSSNASFQRASSASATARQHSAPSLAGESFGRQTNLRKVMADGNGNTFERDSERDGELNNLREQLDATIRENQHFKALLDQSQSSAEAFSQGAFADQMSQIKKLLAEREPNLERLLDEALKQERLKMERKEQKVLEILQFKDRQIEDHKKGAEGMRTEKEQLLQKCQDLQQSVWSVQEKHDQGLRRSRSLEMQLHELQASLTETDILKHQAEVQCHLERIKELELQLASQPSVDMFREALDRCKQSLSERELQLEEEKHRADQLDEQVQFLGDQLDCQRNQDLAEKRQRISDYASLQEHEKLLAVVARATLVLNSCLQGTESQQSIDKLASAIAKEVRALRAQLELLEAQMKQVVTRVDVPRTDSSSQTALPRWGDDAVESMHLQEIERATLGFQEKGAQSTIGGDSNSQDKILVQEHNMASALGAAQSRQGENHTTSLKLLNNKLREMKIREGHLLEQISQMKNQMRYQSSASDDQLTQMSGADESVDHQQIRNHELEQLVFNQREQMLQLEQQLLEAQRSLEDRQIDQSHEIQLLQMRNRNLQLLGSTTGDDSVQTESAPHNAMHSIQMLDFKHRVAEVNKENELLRGQLQGLKKELDAATMHLFTAQQDLQMAQAGVSPKDSHLMALVAEQRLRIQKLEQLQGHSQLSECAAAEGASLIKIREEYVQKLQSNDESHKFEKQNLVQQILASGQRLETLKAQVRQLQTKDEHHTQVFEQLRDGSDQADFQAQQRVRDVEVSLEAKNQLLAGLERELKSKEHTVAERQEQISVLLSAMDTGSSDASEIKQKLANQAAELCTLMSAKSGLEQRLADTQSSLRAIQSNNVKLVKENTSLSLKVTECKQRSKVLTQQIDSTQRQLLSADETHADLSAKLADSKIQIDRLQYQHSLHAETNNQIKESTLSAEAAFRKRVQELKDSIRAKINRDMASCSGRLDLKVLLQKLSLRLHSVGESEYAQELELALKQATLVNEKLESQLVSAREELRTLDQEWDAIAMNQVMLNRYETLLKTADRREQVTAQKDVEMCHRFKQWQVQQDQMQAELEARIAALLDNNTRLEDTLYQTESNLHRVGSEKDSLRLKVDQFDEALRAQKVVCERQAEITLDQRQRAKDQAIQDYFENKLTRLLAQGGSDDRSVSAELGRELCSLKLQIDKLQKRCTLEQAQVDSAQHTIHFYKDQLEESQQACQEAHLQIEKLKGQAKQFGQRSQQQQESMRQRVLNSEKEVVKLQEHLANKQRELNQAVSSQQLEDFSLKFDSHSGTGDDALRRKVRILQEELIEVRASHGSETESLRLELELEMTEQRRALEEHQAEIQRRFSPGTAPGEILDQNHDLREKLAQMQSAESELLEENDLVKQDAQRLQDSNHELILELEDCKRAMIDIENALVGGSRPREELLRSGPLKHSTLSKHSAREPATESKKSQRNTARSQVPTEYVLGSAGPDLQFEHNPPVLVRYLVQAKVSEQKARTLLRRHLLTEANLRQQLTRKLPESELLPELIKQNDSVISILSAAPPDFSLGQDHELAEPMSHSDTECLLQAVMALAYQLGLADKDQPSAPLVHERLPLTKVLVAQRVVLKSLADRGHKVSFAPERELDRKIWYLELLEGQIKEAADHVEKLTDFIKRLQVAVTGNLQSAAEIRATSMDLAHNTSEASEEIKTLRNVAALIKHDLQTTQAAATLRITSAANPFNEETLRSTSGKRGTDFQATGSNLALQTGRSDYERLAGEHDSIQNQLSLTSKIKQSLEQEIISLKVTHAQELQQYINKFREAQSKLKSAIQAEQSLHLVVDDLKRQVESEQAATEHKHANLVDTQTLLEKAVTRADKSSTSSGQMRRLQQDIQEWRRQSDVNLKAKQEQLDGAQSQLAKAKLELAKLKSEVGMLRRVQTDMRSGVDSTAERRRAEQAEAAVKALESEIKTISEDSRAQVAALNSQLDQVHASNQHARVSGSLLSPDAQEASTPSLEQQLNALGLELKSKQSDLVDAKDALSKAKLNIVQQQHLLRESQEQLEVRNQQCAHLQDHCNELEESCAHLQNQKISQIRETDKGAAQLAQEMLDLRETFEKLKAERNDLVEEVSEARRTTQQKELDWRRQVSDLQQFVQRLEGNVNNQVSESSQSQEVLQLRNSALLNSLKFLKEENEGLHAQINNLKDDLIKANSKSTSTSEQVASLKRTSDELRTELNEAKGQVIEKDREVRLVQGEYAGSLADAHRQLKQVLQQYSQLRAESNASVNCMVSQWQMMRQKDKAKPVKEVDFALQVSQKEGQIKVLRKDLASQRSKVSALKQQHSELQDQVHLLSQKAARRGPALATPLPASLPDWKLKLCDLLGHCSFKHLLTTLKEANQGETQLIESQAELQQVQLQLNAALLQVEEQAQTIELVTAKSQEKNAKASDSRSALIEKHNSVQAALKSELKQLCSELSLIKSEYVPPEVYQQVLDQLKDQKSELKAQVTETHRKQKLLGSLRQTKDQLERELDVLVGDLKGLKDDNARLQKALRDSKNGKDDLRELVEKYEWLQKQEKQLKDEILHLNERNRNLKQDLSRKDSQINLYKDKVDQKSGEAAEVMSVRSECDKLVNQNKRLKLELEIKENQNRTLKQRIESVQEEQKSSIQQSQGSVASSVDQELRQSKQKAKRYEQYLRKSIQALKKVGTNLVQIQPQPYPQQQRYNSLDDAATRQNVGALCEISAAHLDYKDSAEILGVSINELQDFLTPGDGGGAVSSLQTNQLGMQDSQNPSANLDSQHFISRLQRMERLPDSLSSDIEEIGEYCCKLIGDFDQHK